MAEIYSGFALRRSAVHFLSGKAASAAITFAILLVLVRLLPMEEYGVYVTFIAAAELGYALGGLGLPWLAARCVPEYRLKASGSAIVRVCYRMLAWQGLAFLALACICIAIGDAYLEWLDLQAYRISAAIFVLVFILEGLGRFVREPLMGPLMRQADARISLVARQGFILASLLALAATGVVDVLAVAVIEVCASTLSLGIGLRLLARELRGLRDRVACADWQEPTLGEKWSFARRMYFSHLVSLAYSSQVLTNIVMRMLGSEATAVFGFLRALNDQVARYLPATLLFSLIRPKLVAGYVAGGGMSELVRNANLAGKLSLFVLVSLIAFVALSGEGLVEILSGGKFSDTGFLLLGFLLGLVPFSQRQLLESVVVVIGRASICVWASASGLLMLPLTWVLIQADFGLWAPVIAIGVGHLAFNAFVLTAICNQDGYRADWFGVIKMVLSAVLTYLMIAAMPNEVIGDAADSWVDLILQAMLVGFVYLIIAWIFKPFSQEERGRINAMVRRRVFVW